MDRQLRAVCNAMHTVHVLPIAGHWILSLLLLLSFSLRQKHKNVQIKGEMRFAEPFYGDIFARRCESTKKKNLWEEIDCIPISVWRLPIIKCWGVPRSQRKCVFWLIKKKNYFFSDCSVAMPKTFSQMCTANAYCVFTIALVLFLFSQVERTSRLSSGTPSHKYIL